MWTPRVSRIRDRMYQFYWAIEKHLAPGLNSSQYCYCNTVRRFLPEGGAWLDLGCGRQVFAEWMIAEERDLAARARRVVGIDLDVAGVRKHQTIHQRVVGNLEELPFSGPVFDFVSANMVV